MKPRPTPSDPVRPRPTPSDPVRLVRLGIHRFSLLTGNIAQAWPALLQGYGLSTGCRTSQCCFELKFRESGGTWHWRFEIFVNAIQVCFQ